MELFAALADPVRRQIIELLAHEQVPARRVAETFDTISRPAVSRHLRVLREAGLVVADVVGRERIYRADLEALDEIERWITTLRPRWDQHLDALETEVYRTRRERRRATSSTTDRPSPELAPTTKEQSA